MPNRPISKLNLPLTGAFSSGPAAAETADATPTPVPAIGPPLNLTLSTANEQSAVTPSSLIGATWLPPYGVAPSAYTVQVATDSAFASIVDGMNVPTESAVFHGLMVSTLYYVRVAAIAAGVVGAWSDTASTTTAADTTPPSVPTGTAASFAGIGDLVVTWANSTSANLRDTEIRIWESSSKVTLYATIYDSTGRYIWTAAQNLAATSNAGDGAVYVELRSRGWNGLFSSAAVVGTITKAAPATPGGITQSWSGDTGTAAADWLLNWTAQSDAAYYLLNINSLGAKRVYANTYLYALATNIADNGAADPTLSYSLIAVDGLNQGSATASGSGTNAAPPAPTIALVGGAMVTLKATVTSAKPNDFAAYEFVWKRDGTTVRTLESSSSEQDYELSGGSDAGAHSWTVVVRTKDAFGQYSSTTTSSAVVLDALTLDYLRGSLAYSDSDANTFTPPASGTLAVLKDGITASGGVTYAA